MAKKPNILFRRNCDCGTRSAECLAHIPLLGPRNINPSDVDRVFTQASPLMALFIEHKQTHEPMKDGQKLLLKSMDSVAPNAAVLVAQGTANNLAIFSPGASGEPNEVTGTTENLQTMIYNHFNIETNNQPIHASTNDRCVHGVRSNCVAHRELFGPEGYGSITIDRVFDDAETKRLLFVEHYLPGQHVEENEEYHLRNLARLSENVEVWITRGTFDDLKITKIGSDGKNAFQKNSTFSELQEMVFGWYDLSESIRIGLREAQAEGQVAAEKYHGPTVRTRQYPLAS